MSETMHQRWKRSRDACEEQTCTPSMERWHAAGCVRRAAYKAGMTEKELAGGKVQALSNGHGFVIMREDFAFPVQEWEELITSVTVAPPDLPVVRPEPPARPWWKLWGRRG